MPEQRRTERHEQRGRQGAPRSAGARGPNAKAMSILALVIAFLVVGFAVYQLRRSGDPEPVGTDVAAESPSPGETAEATPDPETASPGTAGTASPEDAPAGATTESPAAASPGAGGGGAREAEAFAAQYDRDELGGASRWAVADVTGDDVEEVVFASVSGGATRLDVAERRGGAYEVVFQDQGGAAERVDTLTVEDFTGDGVAEIVTEQSSGEFGASLTIWGGKDGEYRGQAAVGGCWEGSYTYGVIGAEIAMKRITATCDESPLPMSSWSSHVYVWQDAWTFEPTPEPG